MRPPAPEPEPGPVMAAWRQVRPGAGQDTGHPPASSCRSSGLLGGFECIENVRNGTFRNNTAVGHRIVPCTLINIQPKRILKNSWLLLVQYVAWHFYLHLLVQNFYFLFLCMLEEVTTKELKTRRHVTIEQT